MATQKSELFIVDNSDSEWKVKKYLEEWCDLSKSFDIATGYFEIGALLDLDDKWQKLEKIKILMGDEVSKRTHQAFTDALTKITTSLDASIESEKEENDFLNGVPAIVNGIKDNKIECRVYKKKKFHAKAYITNSKYDVVGSSALVGSSNFTSPGLNQNIELNIQIRREVDVLQDWFEKHWNDAENVTPEILKTIERHTQDISPFELYVKSLHEFFKGHELSESVWEINKSIMYPILDQYQKDGYHALIKIASQYNGAFLCDGVGLGKTFIGLMLIERLLMLENKRVVLIVPNSARKPVWESTLKIYMPKVLNGFLPFKIINHSDLTKTSESSLDLMESIKDQAEIVIIDEAHHFRNINTSKYKSLFDICENKQVFLLTATPINNSLFDLFHQIELFSRGDMAYFSKAPLGIHNLKGHFLKLEKEIQDALIDDGDSSKITIEADKAKDALAGDDLINSLVVQRSRSYVKKSQIKSKGRDVVFPERKPPIVIDYSLKKTYGKLLADLKDAFNKEEPLLDLVVYYPLKHYIGPDKSIDPMAEGRQKQVVGLIRTLLLKRFESSRKAYEFSCEDLLLKLLAFVRKHNITQCEKWERRNKKILEHIKHHQSERGRIESDDADEDYLPEELLQSIEELSDKEYDIAEIVMTTIQDMDQLAVFINDLLDISKAKDDKLENLIKTLSDDQHLKENKVIIFTEYLTTAQYLFNELKSRGFTSIDEIDGSSKRDRGEVINCFSPYYNGLSSLELKEQGKEEIRILISTDVLAEGLNLQDATLLINYDLHWNPVRLMQRIGRVDRRLNKEIEEKMIKDHPDYKNIRGTVQYWNFLPPEELNELLSLYHKVTDKTLVISKTFGIEGKKLLRPEDDYNALNEFNHNYEGTTTFLEKMHLEYQELTHKYPDVILKIQGFPLKVFSGKEHIYAKSKAIFFCYLLPVKDAQKDEWNDESGFTKWYLYDLENESIIEDPVEIFSHIQCDFAEQRKQSLSQESLKQIREKMDKHIKNTYLRSVQAPSGVKAVLKAWMELS